MDSRRSRSDSESSNDSDGGSMLLLLVIRRAMALALEQKLQWADLNEEARKPFLEKARGETAGANTGGGYTKHVDEGVLPPLMPTTPPESPPPLLDNEWLAAPQSPLDDPPPLSPQSINVPIDRRRGDSPSDESALKRQKM